MYVRPFGLASTIAVLGACSPMSTGGCQTAVSISPDVRMLFPQPGATELPTGPQTLVFESLPNGTSSVPSAPIAIAAGGAATVATMPTAVPSPLPAGAATPYPAPNASSPGLIFAVSYNAGSRSTTYTAFARETVDGCGSAYPTEAKLGTFATQ